MDDTQMLLLGGGEKEVKYPIVTQEFDLCDRDEDPTPSIMDREQIQLSPNRWMIALRHVQAHHWCGYVPLLESEWAEIESSVRAITNVRISFAGEGNQYITWMLPNLQGRLKQPVTLYPGTKDFDFWVGFDTLRDRRLPLIDIAEVREILYGFENIIWRLKNKEIQLNGNHTGV